MRVHPHSGKQAGQSGQPGTLPVNALFGVVDKMGQHSAGYGRRNAGICEHGYLRGETLDYPVYYPSPVYGDLGDSEKILNTTSARPGTTWGGFLCSPGPPTCPPLSLCSPPASPACVASYGLQAAFLRPCPAGRNMSQNEKPP